MTRFFAVPGGNKTLHLSRLLSDGVFLSMFRRQESGGNLVRRKYEDDEPNVMDFVEII